MSAPSSRKRLLLRAFALLILAVAACGGSGSSCGGSGCSGGSDGTYQYPLNDPNRPDAIVQQESARVRITQAFIDFIQPQLPGVITSFLGTQTGMRVDASNVLHVDVPDQDLFDIGVAQAQLRDAEALLWLDDLHQRLVLRFETPNSVRLTIDHLRLGFTGKLKENFGGATSSCPIIGTLGAGTTKHAAEISIDAVIDPGVGPDPDRNFDIRVNVSDIALNELRLAVGRTYCSEPECTDCVLEVAGSCYDVGGRCGECETFCGDLTGGILSVVGDLVDILRPLLNRLLKPVVQNFIRSALGDFNNKPATLEMEVDLAEMLQMSAFEQANPFGIFVAPEPGRFPVIDRGTGVGMEVTATGGAEAELADCVGAVADFNMPKGPVPVLGGTDSMGRPYHVGMTVASALANQVLYAAYRSGTLCLKLTSDEIRELTGGQFTLNAAVLTFLASDLGALAEQGAPLILQLKPRSAPILDFGSGELIGQDMTGKNLYDSLLKLTVEDIGLAFHALIHDRYVRVFEVTMDINVGMNLTVLPDNKLEVAIGELRINDFDQHFNEILPNADFGMLLPTLIDIALQALLANQLTFDLDLTDTVSSALGGAPIGMRINDIMRDGIQEDFLTLTFTFTSSGTGNLSLGAETFARALEQDGLHERRDDGRRRATGRMRLAVGESLAYSTQQELEYQVRVDGGLWRAWQPAAPDGTLPVDDPHLVIPGKHRVEVRARFQQAYQTLDPTPTAFEVLVDPNAPSVSARIEGDQVMVKVTDRESPASALRLAARAPGGPWFPVELAPVSEHEAAGSLALQAVGAAHQLELQATDAIGNTSEVAGVRVGLNPELIEAAQAGCACHDTPGMPHGHSDGWLVAFFAFAVALLWRRSRGAR